MRSATRGLLPLLCLLSLCSVSRTGQAKEVSRLFPVTRGGKVGYIDRTGRLVIAPRYGGPGAPFSEGLAVVRDSKGDYGYIDATSRGVIKPRFNTADDFSGGLARVTVPAPSGFGAIAGYIDRRGDYVWRPRE